MIMKQELNFFVNGIEKNVYVRNSDTLLHIIREKLGLTGTKSGCHNGDCGACTVLIDGIPYNACHLLAVEAANKRVTTIEGLANTIIQEEFVNNWAIQCGYCTPGFILNCHALVTKNSNVTEETIMEWLDSNICRCTGYQEIKKIVQNSLKAGQKNG